VLCSVAALNVAMAEQDEPDLLGGGVGGILEGIGGKLPEANFDLDCSDEVRSIVLYCCADYGLRHP
jgi:hypothetical protein